jgi:hypothetical protein
MANCKYSSLIYVSPSPTTTTTKAKNEQISLRAETKGGLHQVDQVLTPRTMPDWIIILRQP